MAIGKPKKAETVTVIPAQANTSADTRNKAIAFWHATLPKGLSTRLKDLLEDGTCGEADMVRCLNTLKLLNGTELLVQDDQRLMFSMYDILSFAFAGMKS